VSSLYLPNYIENASFAIKRLLARGSSQAITWREAQELTTAYRQRGICSLLLFGTPTDFHVNMMQSAGAFMYFLAHCPEEHKVTSQAKPLFDALDGGYFEAAGTIAARSRSLWNEGHEYQEEFLYAHFIMQLTLLGEGEELTALCDRFDEVQAGTEATRVKICRALLLRDDGSFNAALAELLDKRRENVEAMVERGALGEELWSWLRYFSSEGLALVRLAERAGMETDDRYIDVPEQVRAPSPYAFDPDAWRDLSYSPH